MPRPRLPYLHRTKNRHGTAFWQVRLPDAARTRIRIKAEYGTPDFMAEYQAAVEGRAAPAPVTKASAGSLAWLVARYRDSAAWSALSSATRRQRENIFKHILAAAGQEPHAAITRKVIVAGVDRRRDTPAAARHFIETLRGLFRWAVDADIAKDDPTRDIKVKSKKTDGHHTWTEEEVTRYEARWPLGTRERLAFDVLLYTGLRRGDAVRIGRPHVKAGILTLRTEKTGEVVEIPLLQPLLTSLKAGPAGELTFIAGEKGRPLTKESFGTWFRKACNAAGVPGSAHGLRKAGATRAAENGATVWELEAMFGWSGGRMASLYTRKADRSRLSKGGAIKLLRNKE